MGYYEFIATYTNMETFEETTLLIPVDFRGLSSDDLGTHNVEKAAWMEAAITANNNNIWPNAILSNIEFLSAS